MSVTGDKVPTRLPLKELPNRIFSWADYMQAIYLEVCHQRLA